MLVANQHCHEQKCLTAGGEYREAQLMGDVVGADPWDFLLRRTSYTQ
jgi:hypothetical protein